MFESRCRARRLTLLAGALLLAGCHDHTQIGSPNLSPDYDMARLFAEDTPETTLPLHVYGNPFFPGIDDISFARDLAQAMPINHGGRHIHFTALDATQAADGDSVVMVFNADPAVSGRQLCRFSTRAERPRTSESSGSIPVKMVLCDDRRVLAELPAHLGGGKAITLEITRELARQMVELLLPADNPTSQSPLESDLIPFE